jgi:hypothetical protein
VVLLALEAGLPVIALSGSANADLIADVGAGRVYRDDTPEGLRMALNEVEQSGMELRRLARAEYERSFSRESWLSKIEAVYRSTGATYQASSRTSQ